MLPGYEVKKDKSQFICKSDGGFPKFFFAANSELLKNMNWSESEKSFETKYVKTKKGGYTASLGLVDELQGAGDVVLRKSIRPTKILVEPGPKGYEYNASKINKPIISMVRVMNPVGSPYYVKEYGSDGKGWWYFRGGQSSKEIAGTDLLRLYVSAGKKIQIIFDGFIDNLARPGWGSQYSMLLGDIKKTKDGGA